MVERYFVRPETVDRIRRSWIGDLIEAYVAWLTALGYAPRTFYRRVPILVRFGEFARERGARSSGDLGGHVDDFVSAWIHERARTSLSGQSRVGLVKEIRGPLEQMLRLVVPGFVGHGRTMNRPEPFCEAAPGFFPHLLNERGLRQITIRHYCDQLRAFESYLRGIRLEEFQELSPAILAAFVADSARRLGKPALHNRCVALRLFLRYLHREQLTAIDLSSSVDAPRIYRLSTIPRSVTWDEVRKMLAAVDRRAPLGKRDYAVLLLLVTYGLRAREIAALRVDDVDWKRERLRIPERKGDHSTVYPLSTIVGDALVEYMQHVRPATEDRHLFFRIVVPLAPLSWHAVSARASHYLRKAGVAVSLAGAHTLRHTCVQRLVDADFSLKVIGDYVGHRSSASTEIYSKVAIETLRKVALGDGEEIL